MAELRQGSVVTTECQPVDNCPTTLPQTTPLSMNTTVASPLGGKPISYENRIEAINYVKALFQIKVCADNEFGLPGTPLTLNLNTPGPLPVAGVRLFGGVLKYCLLDGTVYEDGAEIILLPEETSVTLTIPGYEEMGAGTATLTDNGTDWTLTFSFGNGVSGSQTEDNPNNLPGGQAGMNAESQPCSYGQYVGVSGV
jgi:hypothetical protein